MRHGYRIRHIFLFIAVRVGFFCRFSASRSFHGRMVFYNMDLQLPVAYWGSTTLISNFIETMTAEIAHQRKSLNYVTRSRRIDPVWLGKHKLLRGKLRGLFLLRMCTTCWDSIYTQQKNIAQVSASLTIERYLYPRVVPPGGVGALPK